MKKVLSICLSIMLIAVLTACGTAPFGDRAVGGEAADTDGGPTNEITELVDQGYSTVMTSSDESQWNAVFQQDMNYDTVYKVEAVLTGDQYDRLNEIEWDDENGDQKRFRILGECEDVTVTDITDMIPAQEELDAYIGKTLGDMEKDGFENTGNSNWDGIYEFYMDGPVYCCKVQLAEGIVIEDMDDYSVNDLRAMEIGKVEFSGFASGLID